MTHAQERALERYGLTLSNKDMAQVVDDIQQNRGRLLARLATGCSVWALTVKGVHTKLVVSADLWGVVTFLPIDGSIGRTQSIDSPKGPIYRKGKRVYVRAA
jgi:hypothetical protein